MLWLRYCYYCHWLIAAVIIVTSFCSYYSGSSYNVSTIIIVFQYRSWLLQMSLLSISSELQWLRGCFQLSLFSILHVVVVIFIAILFVVTTELLCLFCYCRCCRLDWLASLMAASFSVVSTCGLLVAGFFSTGWYFRPLNALHCCLVFRRHPSQLWSFSSVHQSSVFSWVTWYVFCRCSLESF